MIRRLWRKVTRPFVEAHFKVCRFMYRKPQWYKRYRWGVTTIGHFFALLLIVFFCMLLGVGITQFINKYTIWNALITWYTLLGWGILGLMWNLGLVLVIVGIIFFFDEHIPNVKRSVKNKSNHFRYDMEYEINERERQERYRQQELEREAVRMAAKGKPKWEV